MRANNNPTVDNAINIPLLKIPPKNNMETILNITNVTSLLPESQENNKDVPQASTGLIKYLKTVGKLALVGLCTGTAVIGLAAAARHLYGTANGGGGGEAIGQNPLKPAGYFGGPSILGQVVYYFRSESSTQSSSPQPTESITSSENITNSTAADEEDSSMNDNSTSLHNITLQSTLRKLTSLIVDDIQGDVIATNLDIQDIAPLIFDTVNRARESLVNLLVRYRDSNPEDGNFGAPDLDENPEESLKGLLEYMLIEYNIPPDEFNGQVDELYQSFLQQLNTNDEDFQSQISCRANGTIIERLIGVLNKPCYNLTHSASCMNIILMQQSEEGIEADRVNNRPTTYGAVPHPVTSLLCPPELDFVFTQHVARLANQDLLAMHFMLHEVLHLVRGTSDLMYGGFDKALLNADGNSKNSAYNNKYNNLKRDIPMLFETRTKVLDYQLIDFYDKYVPYENGTLTNGEKIAQLQLLLQSDQNLFDMFTYAVNDFFTAMILTKSLSE